MPNYELRKQLLILNDSNSILDINKHVMCKSLFNNLNDSLFSNYYDLITESFNIKNSSLWEEAFKFNRCIMNNKRRLKNKITSLLTNYECYFLTITFKEEYLNNTSEELRRRHVRRFVSSFCDQFVGNIDFGKKDHREHFHFICSQFPSKYALEFGFKKFGYIKSEKIKTSSTAYNLASYIQKLTNHALKIKDNRSHIIYDRFNKNI